jgi:protein-disulfide isomerase
MKRRIVFSALAIAAAASLGGAIAAAPPRKAAPPGKAAPVPRDWTRTVVPTPQGGFRMGNPAARVKIVEYGSLACPHCAQFAATGLPHLRADYVRTGKVSYEYRNFILNGPDIAASLLARCAGPANFFRAADIFYARQPEWMGRLEAVPADEWARLQTLPLAAQAARYAEIGGLVQLAGVPPRRAGPCLADRAGLNRLSQMFKAGQALGVRRTPTFLINSVMADGNTWEAIEPLIRQAGG